MSEIAARSSPSTRRSGTRGKADTFIGSFSAGEDGEGRAATRAGSHQNPLFHKMNNTHLGSHGKSAMTELEGMRHFAAESTANSSVSSSIRPKTTGSVRQPIACGGGGRRQSLTMISGGEGETHQRHASPLRTGLSRVPCDQVQNPHFSRTLTLSDLRSSGLTAVGEDGTTSSIKERAPRRERDGSGKSRASVRRGWQVSPTRGNLADGVVARRNGDHRDQPGVPDRQVGGLLSRLPLLDSLSDGVHEQQDRGQQLWTQHQLHQSQEQRYHHESHGVLGSGEIFDLLDEGLSFGVSAVKGRRPYMEDEYKVGMQVYACLAVIAVQFVCGLRSVCVLRCC